MVMPCEDTDNGYDALVLGGGPAGSAAATIMGQNGLRVALIEKQEFPRFVVGESLLPFGNDCLNELGVLDAVKNGGFVDKRGAEFTTGHGAGHIKNWFSRNADPVHHFAFQVDRARFDQLLLNRARETGVEVFQPAEAKNIQLNSSSVSVEIESLSKQEHTTLHGNYLIDATGRQAVLARHLRMKRNDLGLQKRIAIYGHFKNVKRPEGKRAGNIVLVRLKTSWFWFIPIDEERTSVGLVTPASEFKASELDPEQYFQLMVAEHTDSAFRMKASESEGKYHVTSDYTYRFSKVAGERWLMTGDASGFVDPVFSSGVYLALVSGIMAGKSVSQSNGVQKGGASFSPMVRKAYTRYVPATYPGVLR